jgi:type IV pilus assembly protein PilX
MKPPLNHARARGQRGLSLITALLFMVAALILGVSVVGIGAMQERMLGNSKDRELALQAAEAALRDAEADIAKNIGSASVFDSACTDGLCSPPSPSPLPLHEQQGFSWNPADGKVRTYGSHTDAGDHPVPKVAVVPVYVIEKLGSMGVPPGESELDPSAQVRTAYRITARATGARDDTVVVLQSIYAK